MATKINHSPAQSVEHRSVQPQSRLRGVVEKISEWVFSRWTLVVASAALVAACFGMLPGLIAGVVATAIALCVKQKPAPSTSSTVQTEEKPKEIPVLSRKQNIAIFHETQQAIRNGEHGIDLDLHRKMVEGAKIIPYTVPLPRRPANPVTTRFMVEPCTTFEMTRQLVERGHRPLVLDMANRRVRGGGVLHGANAQEETLCRQTDMYPALEKVPYPLPESGGILLDDVQFLRDDHYRFIPPFRAGVFVSAAYDCNRAHGGGDRPASEEIYLNRTREKIKAILRTAIRNDYRSLVLGAYGCGAFANSPETIANLFYDILNNDLEFWGAFDVVAFGIYDPPGAKNPPNWPIFHKRFFPTA